MGNKDFGTISFGFEGGMKVVMAEFLQNGIPLIESADGKVQMIKNTQVEVAKGYLNISTNINTQGTNAGLAAEAKIGADIVNIQSDLITIRIPWTDKNVTINGNLGVGAKGGASVEVNKHKQKASAEGGVGITGKLEGKIEDQDFRTETTKDFTF